jgi:hypothetical protein
VIKLFEEFINQDNIVIEIIDGSQWNFIDLINEEFNYFYYHRENKPSIQIDRIYREKLNKVEDSVEDYLANVNPMTVEILNKNNQKQRINLEIKTTEHWYEKFFRKDFEDPANIERIVNPDIYEGVKLIYNNRNLIGQYVINGVIKNGNTVLIKTKDMSNYKEITKFEKSSNGYIIHLLSQMKGPVEYKKRAEMTIRLHPKGPLPKN